jgi:translation initiation factor 4G
MFNILSGDTTEPSSGERAAGADAGESAPQRKRLNLQPRSKPLPGDAAAVGDEPEGEEASDEEPSTPAETVGMSEDAAKTKIASDMKELWGEKDQGGSRNPEDVVEYFRALPEDRRSLLAERIVVDLFRIAKLRDVEMVAKGWAAALEQNVASTDVLVKG